MRILLVAEDLPWPANNGYRIRLSNIARALADAGSVHVVAAATPGDTAASVSPDIPVAGMDVVSLPRDDPHATRLWRWVRSGLPRRLVSRDWTSLRHATHAVLSKEAFDLVWLGHAQSFVAVRRVVDEPFVVDIDNLFEEAIRHRRAGQRDRPGGRRGVRSVIARRVDAIDEGRWERLHAEISREAAAVAVCSELDRRRLGVGNAVVVPNGATIPEAAPVSATDPDRPVVTMIGLLAYEANADAARYFVNDILPTLRTWFPALELRLVGRPGPVVDQIEGTPNVTIVGEVDDVADELARADLVAVPIRFGGGTRLKVLEAFAHRVPVVSTTVGCEGIDLEPGRELLVADMPEAFAAACRDIIQQPELRQRLTSAARDLVVDEYRWEDIRREVTHLALSLGSAQDRTSS
ncbi:MAG: glycosyltransferase family 4 protein [Acidimicrobiia bacterium]